MLPRTFLSASFALGTLALCIARADDSGYVRINLTRGWQNHMLAPVRLNGRDAHFLVDTGAVCSCIDPSQSSRFGFQPDKGVSITLNGRPHGTTHLPSLGIGPVEVRNLQMALVNISEYNALRGFGESRADGILGLDALRLGRAVIDCQQLRLFWKAIPAAPNVMARTLRGAGWTAVKLELKGNRYTADVRVNGVAARFLVDTGAFVTCADRSFARRAGVTDKGKRLRTTGVHIDDTNTRVAYPGTFMIGDFTLKDFPITTSTLHTPGFPLDRSVSGLIGGDVLGKNLGVIDCEQHVLYLKSPGAR